MVGSQEKHHQTIDHLKEKFKLSGEELILLEKIKKNKIHSISFTTEGGFDNESGEFFSEEKQGCYKIQIKYEQENSTGLELVHLMDVMGPSII